MHTLEQLRAGQLAGATRLDLSENLTEFPREIFALADTLEILNLSGNALTALPDDFARLHQLRILFCSDNLFEELPAVLGQCENLTMIGFKANRIHTLPAAALPPRLRWLILTDNQLTSLPPELGHCQHLQKLMLAGNRLAALPSEMAQLHQLELLRLAANQLTELPAWLFTLPRLAWLAYAGNPLDAGAEAATVARHPVPAIPWAGLTLGRLLGEGASGIIHQAVWEPAAGAVPQPVAVKLFKGAVTSDGLPASEMDACIGAGPHPNLIAVQGRVSEHPVGAPGLVMELIDPVFQNLAGPPSFVTCTRDVYAAGTTFTLPALLKLAHGVASAVAHLHKQGITHGDLYAHNILHLPDGTVLLGDFGAASFFPPDDVATATALARLEARAFGHLLGELLARCPALEAVPAVAASLQLLHAACLHAEPAARPGFAALTQQLAALAAAPNPSAAG
ncbi:leucine-rich repeat-containing protein kinase family protein [Hymenobacter sp. ASUV-10]|uniref:Leucine-rich repeat-containing protein kinase family protein n=1 Tax=Hymenobacter aranciens TaxID=3063996 RepID=A0ABT9BF17_9BACT|nr:leucine-rich repeat-containing protein kinase family protein [Hymenobacter sp. ASUV-10]MDO7876856.1 leucine-rich repeat-containing protein kinase family protein [Hymenobacter sp. ASUV-10]